jgi:hypothetical protein
MLGLNMNFQAIFLSKSFIAVMTCKKFVVFGLAAAL